LHRSPQTRPCQEHTSSAQVRRESRWVSCSALAVVNDVSDCYALLVSGYSPLAQLPSTLYAGFDPTASSLHIGNLLVVSQLLRSSALYDCKPIALVGGATALIGDPSGKDKGRVLSRRWGPGSSGGLD
jgi:hypothetical protein